MLRMRVAVPVAAVLLMGFAPVGSKTMSLAPAAYGQQGYYDNVQQLGYQDGMKGARHDFDNHRQPSPENRDEYRNPHVAPSLRRAYREAFRQGYMTAAQQLWGGAGRYGSAAPPPPQQNWDWGMRGLRSDAERAGYREGIEEARKDFQFRRRQDADDHEEYRRPPVPPQVADEYREGFMRGYTVAMSQLNGEGQWQTGGDDGRWAPPDRFNDIERRGFQDGLVGARRDWGNHRRPDPANRDEYRHPDMPRRLWHEYREGFRRGYEMAAMRLWGGR